MAPTILLQPEYQIALPGLDQLVFTASSAEYLTLPRSIQFATERGAILQSAREAWAFRISADDQFNSDAYQSTRTAALGVKIDGDYYIAIDDSPEPAKNILLARAQEGYDTHRATGKWLASRSDPIIQGMLSRAAQGRLFRAQETVIALPLTTRNGTPSYAAHPAPHAIVGRDLTNHVAQYLNQHGQSRGYLWTPSPTKLAQRGVDDDHVEIRRIIVGDFESMYYLEALGAYDHCHNGGYARGVRNPTMHNSMNG